MDYPCEVCGQFEEKCICPECPICHSYGDPGCYTDTVDQEFVDNQPHGLQRTSEQQRLLAEAEAIWAEESNIEAMFAKLQRSHVRPVPSRIQASQRRAGRGGTRGYLQTEDSVAVPLAPLDVSGAAGVECQNRTTSSLDERQQRELEYHKEFAKQNDERITQTVLLDVIEPGPRRPWNSYWTTYDFLMAESLVGKRVLVPGCGFGEDAIRLAKLQAEVYAFDLSPELLAISRQRAARMGITGLRLDVMPAEALTYPDNFFDLVYFNDILHHVDIPKAVAEARRVLKPGGKIVANELYTHSFLQRVRESWLVSSFIYPQMVRFIYGTDKPYITEDEHKINEQELAILTGILQPNLLHCRYFSFFAGRILPMGPRNEKLDRMFACIGQGWLFAGRVVLEGILEKKCSS